MTIRPTLSLVLVFVLLIAGCLGSIQIDDFTAGSEDAETLLSACYLFIDDRRGVTVMLEPDVSVTLPDDVEGWRDHLEPV